MLTPAQKRLCLRHLLLAEIGEAGQERLSRTRIAVPGSASARAAEIALDYLRRAGVERAGTDEEGPGLDLPDDARVAALAGDPMLADAAATLAGAFAAVEAIKRAVGAGAAARLPDELVLAKDPD